MGMEGGGRRRTEEEVATQKAGKGRQSERTDELEIMQLVLVLIH